MAGEWLTRLQSGRPGYRNELRPPASDDVLCACDEQLGKRIPAAYRRFLSRQHDGGVILARDGKEPAYDGLHLFGASPDEHGRTVATETDERWSAYGDYMRGLTVIGHTPGAGAFYLAMTGRGQIVDLFGSPSQEPRKPSPYPYHRGEWRVIAAGLDELVSRMIEAQPDPFYWFRN